MARMLVSSGGPWESRIGYSRAVRVANHVFVSGTTAVLPDGRIVGEGDPYAQTMQALETVRVALEGAGASLAHVVRTRMYVTDITRWDDIGRAHGEVFRDIRPAAAMVEVARLIDPRMLVEIEVDAVIEE